MAIGTVTWAAAVAGTTGNLTPAQPSPAAGDLMLCFCYDFAQITSWTQPAGWSTLKNVAVTSRGTYAIFYKTAAGSEGSATITCAATGTGNSRIARICKIPGAGGQAADFIAGVEESESSTPYANAGVNTTGNVDGCLTVYFGATMDCITNAETDSFGTPSGGTNQGTWSMASYGTTSGSDCAIGIGTSVQSAAGAAASISSTLQASQTTYNGITYTFAIKPTSIRSGTTAGLSGTGTLGAPTSTRAASGTVADLAGAGDLGTATGTASVPSEDRTGTALGLSGTGALSTADGFSSLRYGTGNALAGAGALGTATGAHTGTATMFTGTGALSTADGFSSLRYGTALALSGTGALSTADGSAAAGEVRTGTALALAGSGSIGSPTSTRAGYGTTADLVANLVAGLATGQAALGEDRSGVALPLETTAALGLLLGSKAVSADVLSLTGNAVLGRAVPEVIVWATPRAAAAWHPNLLPPPNLKPPRPVLSPPGGRRVR